MNKNKIIVFFVGLIITTVIIFFVNEINVVNKNNNTAFGRRIIRVLLKTQWGG